MAEIVRRAYTYVGASQPTVFYYHQLCWGKAAPKSFPRVTTEEAHAPRGSVQLISSEAAGIGDRCFQCGSNVRDRQQNW